MENVIANVSPAIALAGHVRSPRALRERNYERAASAAPYTGENLGAGAACRRQPSMREASDVVHAREKVRQDRIGFASVGAAMAHLTRHHSFSISTSVGRRRVLASVLSLLFLFGPMTAAHAAADDGAVVRIMTQNLYQGTN